MLNQDAVRRLTVVATDTGLTAVNTKLAQTNRLFDQGAASAARYATATEALDRRTQALLRHRDRMVTSFNAGGGGGVAGTAAGDVGAFAMRNVVPIVAGIGAIAGAYAALNAVWERGSDLLEKYANAHRLVDRDDLASNLEALTKFQQDTITAAQVQRATELGVRLQDAKFEIERFFKVHMDIVDPALKLQAAWVRIVETIASGTTQLGAMFQMSPPAWLTRIAEGGIGATPLGLGLRGWRAALGGDSGPEPSLDQSLAAARGRLGAAMGVANIGKDGAPLGDSFAARFGDNIAQLKRGHEEQKTVANQARDAWDRALDSVSRSIALQEAELKAVGLGVAAQSQYRVEAQLLEAAERAGVEVTGERAAKFKELGERARTAAQALAEARASSDLGFERDQMGRSGIEQRVASQLRGIYGDDFQSQMNGAIAQQIRLNENLKIGKDLATDFASGFARDMMNGVSAAEAFSNSLKRIADKLIEMATQNLVSQAFGGMTGGGGLLGSLFGLGGAGAGAGASSYMMGGVSVPLFHGGGVVGQTAVSHRFVHPAYFENAPRFHSGGEVPALLMPGEEVLTRDNPRHRANGGGQLVQLNYAPVIDARGADAAAVARIERQLQKQSAEFEARVTKVVREGPSRRML